MAINFPASPSANQIYTYSGNVYKWDGSKWRKSSILNTPIITEYTEKTTQTASTVDLDTSKYDYFKITVDGDISFSFPTATKNTSFMMELNYTPETSVYDIDNASYDNTSFSVTSQDIVPIDIAFNSDGTRMYIVGYWSSTIYQYTLSTAWDLSTASYASVSFSVVSQESYPTGVFFKPDGTKMYIVGLGSDRAYQYTLSTAWDLSTASYDSVSFSVASQDSSPAGVFFKNDGTKMYILGYTNETVYQYTLSTAWDLSTASYDSVSFSVASQDTNPWGITFSSDGTRMFIVGDTNDSVFQYTLSTAWDLSSASYDSVSFSVASQENTPYGTAFSIDGTRMYIVGNTDSIFQYSTSTSATRTITWSSNVQWAGGNAPTIDYTYSSNIIIHFYTTDGVNWIGSPLSLDSRSS